MPKQWYVVTCVKNTVRFYISEDWTATDIPERARRFLGRKRAEDIARRELDDPAWTSDFKWSAEPEP